ncbi:hypothetical protein THAOC_07440 [Thalassiosira oceanica]|uniref:Uncharacterized protein n=1 Tax=Thalassiosira oceanica TaxID=159749 RepID=K0SXJ3_THAOC|nr:hypothetical protein THAOC_07440 [Thalassiosira oceanica]|eukprot:EJK71148.1 hypothetical protein THAOC_07440 [Thalassiosira oceanica]
MCATCDPVGSLSQNFPTCTTPMGGAPKPHKTNINKTMPQKKTKKTNSRQRREEGLEKTERCFQDQSWDFAANS